MSVVFSTCWYSLKAKFPESTYKSWMDNMLSSVNHHHLVLYTDKHNYPFFFSKYGHNQNIKIIVKPIEEFYNYRHRDFWNNNHLKNPLLNTKINWELNMLWCEKVHFVHQTYISQYFPKCDYYGWIDIGYFRCRPQLDVPREQLHRFPNPQKISQLNPDKIHYALVNNDMNYIQYLFQTVQAGQPLPQNQISIAGGFFIGHKHKIEWWKDVFTQKLEQYIAQGSVVKDDQIIIVDCVLNDFIQHSGNFDLHQTSSEMTTDPWFLFSHTLL
jgi:hypothetical protein